MWQMWIQRIAEKNTFCSYWKIISKVDIISHGIMYPYTDVFLFSTISANLTELSEKKTGKSSFWYQVVALQAWGVHRSCWPRLGESNDSMPWNGCMPLYPHKTHCLNYNVYIYIYTIIQYIMYDLPKFQHGTLPNLTLSANHPAKMVHISIPTTQFHYLLSLHCLLTWHLLWLLGLLLRLYFMKPRASSKTWSSQPIHANTLK